MFAGLLAYICAAVRTNCVCSSSAPTSLSSSSTETRSLFWSLGAAEESVLTERHGKGERVRERVL